MTLRCSRLSQRVVESALQKLMAGANLRTQVCQRVHSQVAQLKIVAADEDQLVQCQHTQVLTASCQARATRRQQMQDELVTNITEAWYWLASCLLLLGPG
jgi:hypothetical protein